VNLKQELETLKAEKATAEKDTKWNAMKANLPEGWLGAKEPETRKEFEADPGAFALKVVAFKNTQAAGAAGRGHWRDRRFRRRGKHRGTEVCKHGRRGREGDRDPVCVR